jgi:hypothetical protein
MSKIRRNLFMTWYGRMIVILSVLAFSGMYYLKASGHFSPGPLSAAHPNDQVLGGVVSHADLEKDCQHCHAPLHCVTDTRCQDCHAEIAQQRMDVSSLHGRLPGTSRCQNCHVEHQGADANITTLAFANVNHEKLANFSLSLHSRDFAGEVMDCQSCHSQNNYDEVSLDCVTCHAQESHDVLAVHIETYGNECITCHDGTDRMIGFQHDQIFVLDGGHDSIECDACHANKVFIGTSSVCGDCHPEPDLHAGIFGMDCARCHSTFAWAPAELHMHTFVLEHGGESVDSCETCHAGTYTEYPCYSCHEDAEMQRAHMDDGIIAINNCVDCHPTGRGGELVYQPAPGTKKGDQGQPEGAAAPPREDRVKEPGKDG